MVRTRFAPSPTGYLHIGGLRTAAYAYALAKHEKGQFLLRIEDTDQKRQVIGATEKIFDLMKLFNLNWDGEAVIQSQRAKQGVYRVAAQKLLDSGHAFYCQCAGRNSKTDGFSTVLRDPCRDKGFTSGAVKLRIPDGKKITYHDFVLRHDVAWDSDKVPDTVLLKSDGLLATYHLAVAVDDHDLAITHVIRAVEWLTSTPIHVLVHRYLNYPLPQIGHPSAILDPEGGKLSKRKGNVSVEQFIADGYLPEALLNFIILLGWAPKDNRELFTLEEFVSNFDINGFQKSNPLMNLDKLDWFNGHYIRLKSDTELTQLVKPHMKTKILDSKLAQIVSLVRDRLVKLSDFDDLTTFFVHPPRISIDMFSDNQEAMKQLSHAVSWINNHDFSKVALEVGWTDDIKSQSWKVGDYFMSLRIAVCGSRSTPPITETMVLLGKEESLSRIKTAINLLST